jgi:hypothetical protein
MRASCGLRRTQRAVATEEKTTSGPLEPEHSRQREPAAGADCRWALCREFCVTLREAHLQGLQGQEHC